MKIDLKSLQPFIDEKYISVRKHPTADLWIYDYTARAQYDKKWTPETMMCRGLVLDAEGNIIARPFPKFFNFGEYQGTLPPGKPECFEKLDGSLGILYWIGDVPYITTRGSFESEQAKKGTEILRRKYPSIIKFPELTFLFEIIYPKNRIVVDYEGMEDLILLDVINNATGDSIFTPDNPIDKMYGGFIPVVKKYEDIDFRDPPRMIENKEGFVFKWPNGLRLKFKFDEYVRLHRLITGVNAKRIWEILSNNQDINELLYRVPDEFYKWVNDMVKQIKTDFSAIEKQAKEAFLKHAYENMSRKDAANHIMQNYHKISAVIFYLLDGKNPTALIWKMIKPKHETPFKIDLEG